MTAFNETVEFTKSVRFRAGIQGHVPASFGVMTYAANILTAGVNTPGTILLPEIAGFRYRIFDWAITARGGTTAGATSAILEDTNSSNVVIATALLAALTRDVTCRPNSANVTCGLGMNSAGLTSGKGVQIIANGTFSGATSFDVVLVYALEQLIAD